VHNSGAGDRARVPVVDPLPGEAQFTTVSHETRDRIEEGGLAGAIKANHGNRPAFVDPDANTIERLGVSIAYRQSGYLEKRTAVRRRGDVDLGDVSLDHISKVDFTHSRSRHHLGRTALGNLAPGVHDNDAIDEAPIPLTL